MAKKPAAKKIEGGFLIAVEGIDGAGKTTQVNELEKGLRNNGFEAITFKEPTTSEFGRAIRNIAMHNNECLNGRDPEKENRLFMEDRKIDVKKNISPNLKKGKAVIMDRYFYSNIAYQGVLGLDVNKIKKENESIFPTPDLVLILDVAPKVGISRITFKRGETANTFEKKDYLEKVREAFNSMAEYPNVRIIKADGKRTIKDVADELLDIAMESINKKIQSLSFP